MGKTIWDLLVEPLEAEIYILTNDKHQMLKLVCPTRDQLEALNKALPDPEVPMKEIEVQDGKRKKKIKEADLENPDYLKALDDRETEFGLRLIDLGIKDRPPFELEDRLAIYKKLPNPVLQQILTAIQYLMAHEIPPLGKPEDEE